MDRCGAKRRDGEKCRQPAGHGTEFSYGPCIRHGGQFPAHQKRAARKQLVAEGLKLGMGLDVRPEDLMLTCVRQAAGSLQVAIERLGRVEGEPSDELRRQHADALDRAADIARVALKAGIAERRLRLAQRTGALIAAAFEHAMADLPMEPADRQRLVARFEGKLLALEQGGEDIEGEAA